MIVAINPDGDSIQDDLENCIEVSNVEQLDSDGDGFGNRCDSDLNNDCIINSGHLNIFRAEIFGSSLKTDFNGDGTVDNIDLLLLINSLLKSVGPSGTVSCLLP